VDKELDSNVKQEDLKSDIVKIKPENNLGEKLLQMAGYGNISATAYMLSLKTDPQNDTNSVFKITENIEGERKIYIPTYINKMRIVGCVDSGSDVTILQFSKYKRIFKHRFNLDESKIPQITTFSNHNIPVLGKIQCLIKLERDHPGIQTNIYVIGDIANVPTFLLGNDFLKRGLGLIAYTGCVDNPTPEIIFNYPNKHICTVYYEYPQLLYTCTANCTLEPHETQTVEFYLTPAAPVLRNDNILITSMTWDSINIIPSKSELEFDYEKDCYVATGLVANISREYMAYQIRGKFELVNNYKTVHLNSENKYDLKTAIRDYPMGREVLFLKGNFEKVSIPVVSVNFINQYAEQLQVSDLDMADTIKDKEPTYEGEVEISQEIIEPQGPDLPTIVYQNAEEAINLNSFSPEIRPFIKDIFIDKYPGVVALHSLDAGNLSLTLGFTQLRLREGEVLPRSKRIFHISPSDQKHLDDICELLIKFGYIMRAPVSPNGCHLYGMSAYLVPRAKPNCLGRLIVDFSPVNQLIQSPPSVIPEISATLQFLQGKAMYSSLDLKYAYLALRIDEESRPLTTFLTPTGSYQWLSLPTGAANSPAYFTDACDKILHFEPVRDENGEVVFDAPNLVKQIRSPLEFIKNYFDDILCATRLGLTYENTLRNHFGHLETAIQRLCFHGARISVDKCEFGKSKILFLGWYISHDYVLADPRILKK